MQIRMIVIYTRRGRSLCDVVQKGTEEVAVCIGKEEIHMANRVSILDIISALKTTGSERYDM